jgi:hypothetical protein
MHPPAGHPEAQSIDPVKPLIHLPSELPDVGLEGGHVPLQDVEAGQDLPELIPGDRPLLQNAGQPNRKRLRRLFTPPKFRWSPSGSPPIPRHPTPIPPPALQPQPTLHVISPVDPSGLCALFSFDQSRDQKLTIMRSYRSDKAYWYASSKSRLNCWAT